MSIQNQLTRSETIKEQVRGAIEKLRSSSPVFENAYDTYIQQYGEGVICVNDPINLVYTIEPVILVLGRTASINYSDSRKTIYGTLGSMELKQGSEYIIGRRQPQDSKVVVWSPEGNEVELERYNPEAGVIPSRVHAAVVFQDEQHLFFTDLCSSSGTVIVGESRHRGSFLCVYDPGSVEFPMIKLDWISTERKD